MAEDPGDVQAEAVPRQTPVTGEELVRHLMEEYGAYEVPVSEGCRRALRMNAMIIHAGAQQAHTDIMAAGEVDDERYGFEYKCVALPLTERTARFYAEADSERAALNGRSGRRRTQTVERKPREIVFAVELSTGYCQLNDGCKSLMDEITLWRGVMQQDIDNETAAFMAYAAAMRDTGRLNV